MYSNRQIVFTNKIGQENSCIGNFKHRFVEQRLLSQWRKFVFRCFSQYMSLYISFTLMSTTKFLRKKHIQKVWFGAWSLHCIFTTSFGIKFCIKCSSSAELFWSFFADLSVSLTVECSRSIRIFVFSEPVLLGQFYCILKFSNSLIYVLAWE